MWVHAIAFYPLLLSCISLRLSVALQCQPQSNPVYGTTQPISTINGIMKLFHTEILTFRSSPIHLGHFFYRHSRFEIRVWMNSYIHCFLWDIITHPYPNFNGCSTKQYCLFHPWLPLCHCGVGFPVMTFHPTGIFGAVIRSFSARSPPSSYT